MIPDDLMNALFDSKNYDFPPVISREDGLRIAEQLDGGRSIVVNGKEFVPTGHGTHQPTPDKDLYFLLRSSDKTRSIEIVVYLDSLEAEFNYPERVTSIIDADGTSIKLIPQTVV